MEVIRWEFKFFLFFLVFATFLLDDEKLFMNIFLLCLFSVMYVVFSDKTGGLGAKIIMYSYVTATIALGFVNDFFIAVDFLYFNISTGVSASLLLRMACVYIITIVFLYMLTLIRGSEKT